MVQYPQQFHITRPMRFDILTIFPHIFDSWLQESIIKRAIQAEKIEIHIHDIRTFSKEKHHKVDAPPFGGGPGMVMMAQPIYDCIQQIKKLNKGPVMYMSPRGKILTQASAEKLYNKISKLNKVTGPGKINRKVSRKKSNHGLVLLCGRYEGVDQRVIDLCVDEELSIGKYVLTGGELPAMVVVDTISRFVPGVLGEEASMEEESFSKALKGKKEYPHYTQPRIYKGKSVPDVLLSGHHANIKKWRQDHLQ